MIPNEGKKIVNKVIGMEDKEDFFTEVTFGLRSE